MKPRILGIVLPCLTLFCSAIQAEQNLAIVYPLVGTYVSSKYGNRNHPIRQVQKHHSGIDLAAPKDAPIRVIRDGVVVFADKYKAYGNLIVVDHGGGLTTHYGHCTGLLVAPGKRVTAGQIIATVGSTGRVTGPHLHFEIRKGGKPLNPSAFFPALGAKAEG